MDSRHRYLAANLFGVVDRIPLRPGNGRTPTWERWHREGLPHGIKAKDIAGYAYELSGGRLPKEESGEGFRVDERMIPFFEEKVIQRGERNQIVQDWKGNICEISNEFTTDYLSGRKTGFVTRRWIKCPVESRDDWTDMQKRYDPFDPARFPPDTAERAERLSSRTWPIEVRFAGPFWQLREWMGFEQLCMAFLERPAFVKEMLEFWQEYISELLQKTFSYIVPDELRLNEDMAYKHFSMISPAMCREFLMPVWRRWGDLARSAGVKIYAIDSDGYIGELIPLWIECGVNACDPIEVAAGNDIVAFRKRFGKDMAYRGGIDKRCIAEGSDAIDKELARIAPLIKDGGYIPGCDHAVPHDVSWSNYVRYVKLLAEATGWM